MASCWVSRGQDKAAGSTHRRVQRILIGLPEAFGALMLPLALLVAAWR